MRFESKAFVIEGIQRSLFVVLVSFSIGGCGQYQAKLVQPTRVGNSSPADAELRVDSSANFEDSESLSQVEQNSTPSYSTTLEAAQEQPSSVPTPPEPPTNRQPIAQSGPTTGAQPSTGKMATKPKPPPEERKNPSPKPPVRDESFDTHTGDPFFHAKDDFSKPGTVIATIYHVALASNHRCDPNARVAMLDKKGGTIAKVCKAFLSQVKMEGTGLIDNVHPEILVNVSGTANRFVVVDRKVCPYGLGRKNMCLLPFITIAADTRYYKVGDVIYVPEVADAKIRLPNNEIHQGYFVVVDTGGAIDGTGRFDFFTGEMDAFAPDNPFYQIGLQNKKDKKLFHRVEGRTADKVRDHFGIDI